MWEKTTSSLGDINGLDGWSSNKLANLLAWMASGVVFSGDAWTSANLSDAQAALNLVRNDVGGITQAALGLGNGGRLTLSKKRGDEFGGKTAGNLNLVYLFMPGNHDDYGVEVVTHELGHIVDWHAGNNLDFSLSETEPWLAAGGWIQDKSSGKWTPTKSKGFPTQYASEALDPREDFADTFTWHVYTQNNLQFSRAKGYIPSQERQDALNVALDKFR